jgi:MFS family permease
VTDDRELIDPDAAGRPDPPGDTDADTAPEPDSGPGSATRPAMFRSLRVRNFRLFMMGQSVSVAGTWMQNVAVGWLTLELSGSGGVLGTVIAARFAPLLVLGPWGGLVADRHDKRTLLRITASCQVVVAAVIGTLALTHVIGVWSLGALILLAGVVDVFDTPARQTFINNMVGPARLGNAIALNSIVVNGARIVGPALAGFLIAHVGAAPCFYANAGSYLAVIASLQLMRAHELQRSRVEARGRGQVRAGLRYVWHTPELLVPLLLVAITGAFAWEFQVTLPLFVEVFHGNAATYGASLAAVAVGSIVGGFVAARRHRIDLRVVAVSAALWGVVIIAAAAAPTLTVAYVLLALVGSGTVTFNSVSKTVLQTESDEVMRGRVMSLWSIGWQGSTVVGAPLVGLIGQWLDGRYALGVGGVTTLLAGVAVLVFSRGYTRRALSEKTLRRSSSDRSAAST